MYQDLSSVLHKICTQLAVLILGVLNNVSVHPDLRVVLQRCIPSITTLSATKVGT